VNFDQNVLYVVSSCLQEVECLQDHYENLDKACQWAIGNFTQDEDEDPQLDRILIKACTPMIKEFCEVGIGSVCETRIQAEYETTLPFFCWSCEN
jgi:hypothetical protein